MQSGKIIQWCVKQKSGIRIEKPSDNLSYAYIKEANDALISMKVNIDAGLKKWAMITAYYARYNAIYSMLAKIGIRSEIHDCSIVLVRYLFSGLLDNNFFEELEKSKEQRINAQYYTNRSLDDNIYRKNINSAAEFVLKAEKSLENLNIMKINEAREKIRKLIQ